MQKVVLILTGVSALQSVIYITCLLFVKVYTCTHIFYWHLRSSIKGAQEITPKRFRDMLYLTADPNTIHIQWKVIKEQIQSVIHSNTEPPHDSAAWTALLDLTEQYGRLCSFVSWQGYSDVSMTLYRVQVRRFCGLITLYYTVKRKVV